MAQVLPSVTLPVNCSYNIHWIEYSISQDGMVVLTLIKNGGSRLLTTYTFMSILTITILYNFKIKQSNYNTLAFIYSGFPSRGLHPPEPYLHVVPTIINFVCSTFFAKRSSSEQIKIQNNLCIMFVTPFENLHFSFGIEPFYVFVMKGA